MEYVNEILFQRSPLVMMKKHLYLILTGCLVASIATSALATTPPRITPEVGDYGVIWQGEGITFEYFPGCTIEDDKWFPEAYCRQDSLYIESELEIKDLSARSNNDSRPVKMEDLTVWVDGEKVPSSSRWGYGRRLEDTLKGSADKHIAIAIQEEIGGRNFWHQLSNQSSEKPEVRYFEYVLANYDTVTTEHRQEVSRSLNKIAKKRQRTSLFIGLVVFIIVIGILWKLIPASIRMLRSTKMIAYQKAHQAKDSVSKATYDYRINREVERMRLKEEAEKRRDIERQKESFDEQLRVALEEEDHEKAQELLKQLADLKTKKLGDNPGLGMGG